MAVIDWDYILWNSEGKECGEIITPKGTKIEPYKNWIYIHNETLWNKDLSMFTYPVIAKFIDGEVKIADVSLIGKRDSDSVLFFLGYYFDKNKGDFNYFGGIAGYILEEKDIKDYFNLDLNSKIFDTCYSYNGGEETVKITVVTFDNLLETEVLKEFNIPIDEYRKIPFKVIQPNSNETIKKYKSWVKSIDPYIKFISNI